MPSVRFRLNGADTEIDGVISAVVFGTNLFGDALRDLLDPRQRI